MEQNLFSLNLKYRLRKTDELVEVIAWETVEKGARNENNWVSYIDSLGNEHIKEPLTLEWDFIAESPFAKSLLGGFGDSLTKIDIWEPRRYEMVWKLIFRRGYNIEDALSRADSIISALKPQD